MLNNNLCQSPTSPEQLAHTSFTPPMSPTAGHPVNTAASNKFQFDPNLSYAEKVAHEMIITEKIYLDNLKQIIDVSINGNKSFKVTGLLVLIRLI